MVALTHLVGLSRAYLLQIELARAELSSLGHDDLALLLKALDGAEVAVCAVESVGTARLRETP